MMMKDWWQRNRFYAKAWVVYIAIMWLVQVINVFIFNSFPMLKSLGFNDHTARYIMWGITTLLWAVASFFVFCKIIRVFIVGSLNRPKDEGAEQGVGG